MRPAPVLLLASLLALSCCVGIRPEDYRLASVPPEDTEPARAVRTSLHPETGEVVARWTVLAWPDGRVVRHGREQRFYPDGTPRALRHHEHGKPVGEWRSWYEDGTLRSEYVHDPDGLPTTMRFFHPDGSPSAEGPAIRGLREGEWTFWYPDGTVRQAGPYRRGHRHGSWTLRWENGGLRSRGRYEEDRRVPPWKHWPELPPTLEEPARDRSSAERR